MQKIKYITYIPAGNDTAFVLKRGYTKEEKKKINDAIMKKESNIEQVGFVELGKEPELEMAGGEFCGNATRSAAHYYLEGKEGELILKVNGKDYIKAGINEKGEAYCEIPLYKGNKKMVEKKENGIYQVRMQGMVTIVIEEENAKKYLENKDKIKEETKKIIEKYQLTNEEAVGVMYLEREKNMLKINPIVWVNEINTMFYETACGSGTTGVGIVQAYKENKNQKLNIVQPSGNIINITVEKDNEKIIKAVISGEIYTDGKVKEVEIL